MPGTAASGTPITLTIDAKDACLGCFTTLDECKVAVKDDTIFIGMSATTCTPAGDVGCPAICMIPMQKCTLPPLSPGEYKVVLDGSPSSSTQTPRTLVVTADSTETGCTLTQPGLPPPSLDLGKYSTSCSVDEDCMLVTGGNLCQVCTCPSAAIAKTETSRYGADVRALSSQCTPGKDPAICGACAPAKATCDTSSGLTGTCKLTPGF